MRPNRLILSCVCVLGLSFPALADEPDAVPFALMPKYLRDAPAVPAAKPEAPPAEGADAAAELAKKLSNPVAALISVPFQFNYDDRIGPKDDGYRLTLNIQPVIPIGLSEDWNLISRTIIPVVYQDNIFDGTGSQFGMGDTLQSLFFSPAKPKDFVWGLGPVFLFPTGTDDLLGGGKWAAGPTGLILKQEKGWTYGILANHLWSFASDSDRSEINSTFLQPFLAYTTPTQTTFTVNTESTYDWVNSQWTVPVLLQVAQLVKLGGHPVQFPLGGRYWVEGPDSAPEWGIRLTVTFLFPK
jgi:hypothetical protein